MPAIHVALSDVMRSIGAVKKGQWNEHQKFNFRGIDALHNAVYPALCEHGVVVLPEVVNATYAEVKTSTGKDARQATLTVRYTFVGPDGDQLSVTTVGEAMDSADKATSKALAAAFKYALLQTFTIPTEGQDDADAHSPERGGQSRQERAESPQEPRTPPAGTRQPPAPDPGRVALVKSLYDRLPAAEQAEVDEKAGGAGWWAAMSDVQLDKAAKRLEERHDALREAVDA